MGIFSSMILGVVLLIVAFVAAVFWAVDQVSDL